MKYSSYFRICLCPCIIEVNYAWIQASATTYMRKAFFRALTKPAVIIFYWCFETTYRSHLQGSSPLNMGPIGCPETSVRNYYYLLHNSTEECSSLPQISFKYISQLILQLMLECAFHLTMWQILFFQIDIKYENITVRMKNRATLILPMFSN